MVDNQKNPDWKNILIEPFVGLILGQRGSGKTALGHRLLELFGENTERDAYILGFPDHLEERLPGWVEVLPPTTGRDEWPEGSVVLVHEAHQLIHARRSMEGANVEIDELVTVSRHRDSDIIFETQQSQRLDRNAVTSVDAVIFREPALMQADFERSGMKKIVRAADEYFDQFVETIESDDYTFREKSDESKKHAYIHSSRFVGGYPHKIDLADHWTESISKAYAEVKMKNGTGEGSGMDLDDDEWKVLEATAEWERENRPIKHSHKGVEHSDLPIPRAWTELDVLHSKGLLKQTFDSNSSTYYRLTEDGWDAVEGTEPDAPELADEAVED